MKIHTIVGGVNGAGKSSFIGSLKYQRDDLGVIIDVDKITSERYKHEVGEAAVKQLKNSISSGINFTLVTTLSSSYPIEVATAAKEAGYYIRLFYIGIDTLQESIKRVKNRVALGGHDIPLAEIERHFKHRFDLLKKVLLYCNEAIFFDNRNGFIEIAKYRNGEIIPYAGQQPNWLMELMDNFNQLYVTLEGI